MNVDLNGLSPEIKIQLAEQLKAEAKREQSNKDIPIWFNGSTLDEVAYCEQILKEQDLRSIGGNLYNLDGLITDSKMQAKIANDIKPYIRNHLDKAVDRILKTIKILCISEPIIPTEDRIHFQNGTLFLNASFKYEREWTMNRLPVKYDPNAPAPKRWLSFLSELLEDEDIVTLQEYLGYTMIATNKGQAMLLLIGNGGEGKSRISAIMQSIFGQNLNMGDISKLERDKFCLANQEGKLLFIDDDIRLEALSSTNTIKTIITCDGMMELEKKNQQSYQGLMYVRIIGLGNGTLKAVHDKTRGFYRRQIVIRTKDRPNDRIDDPYLTDKLKEEISGIVLWCVEGLRRLISNNYSFTISDKSQKLKNDLIEEDNNVQAFLDSDGYIFFDSNYSCTSKRLFEVYQMWCLENAYKPVTEKAYFAQLQRSAEKMHIKYNKNVKIDTGRYARGYEGIGIVTESNKNGNNI